MSQGQGATTVTRLELDETLQEGFRSLAELPNEELSDETREQVWLAVSGQLPTAERRALIVPIAETFAEIGPRVAGD